MKRIVLYYGRDDAGSDFWMSCGRLTGPFYSRVRVGVVEIRQRFVLRHPGGIINWVLEEGGETVVDATALSTPAAVAKAYAELRKSEVVFSRRARWLPAPRERRPRTVQRGYELVPARDLRAITGPPIPDPEKE